VLLTADDCNLDNIIVKAKAFRIMGCIYDYIGGYGGDRSRPEPGFSYWHFV
jgi:hypothetical protein